MAQVGIVYKRGASGQYTAECPDIPDLKAVGRSLDECRDALEEAAIIFFEGRPQQHLQQFRARATSHVEMLDIIPDAPGSKA